MLGDSDKPKILTDNASLEPDWLNTKYKMDKKDMWWDKNTKARYDRNFFGTFVNIFYVFILVTELSLPFQIVLLCIVQLYRSSVP